MHIFILLVSIQLFKKFLISLFIIWLCQVCGTWDLLPSLWHADSLAVACKLIGEACGI